MSSPAAHQRTLVVIGPKMVGKTCLIKRVMNESVVSFTKYTSTIDECYNYACKMKDGKFQQIQILDTAGWDEFPAMQNLYVRNSQLILVVYDASSPKWKASLSGMLAEVHRIKENADIIVVGTKVDRLVQVTNQLSAQAHELTKGRCLAHLYASALTQLGIDEVREAITSTRSMLTIGHFEDRPNIRKNLKNKAIHVKDTLSNMLSLLRTHRHKNCKPFDGQAQLVGAAEPSLRGSVPDLKHYTKSPVDKRAYNNMDSKKRSQSMENLSSCNDKQNKRDSIASTNASPSTNSQQSQDLNLNQDLSDLKRTSEICQSNPDILSSCIEPPATDKKQIKSHGRFQKAQHQRAKSADNKLLVDVIQGQLGLQMSPITETSPAIVSPSQMTSISQSSENKQARSGFLPPSFPASKEASHVYISTTPELAKKSHHKSLGSLFMGADTARKDVPDVKISLNNNQHRSNSDGEVGVTHRTLSRTDRYV